MPAVQLARLCAAAIVAAACAAAALAQPQPGEVALEAAQREGQALQVATLRIDGRPLFRVVGLAMVIPAEERATRIAERITAFADDPALDPSSIRIEGDATSRTIIGGDSTLLVVTGPDAALMHLDLERAAKTALGQIVEAIGRYRAERTPASLRDAALRGAAALGIAAVLIALVWLGVRRAQMTLERRYDHRVRAVGIQSFEIVRAERIRSVIHGTLTATLSVAVIVLLLAALNYALAQFPWTREFAVGAVALVLEPLRVMGNGLVRQIPNLAFLIVLLIVVRVLLRILQLFFEAVARGSVRFAGFEPEWGLPTYKLLRVAIVAFALIVAYPYIPGSASDAFKGISIFVGIVFSLASTTAVANLMAGYALIYRRAFRVGDRIKVGDITGTVIRSTLQVTHLRTVKNEDVVVPNAQLLNGQVVNYSTYATENGLIVPIVAGIGYETPWRQVDAMLRMAAERTKGIATGMPPFVRVLSLGDFAVNYELNVPIADAQKLEAVRTELAQNVLDVFNEYGVQIMTPAYEGDPESPKVVKRADWHLPPAPPAPGA
jgi:small-conductance mechanosensitive channel